MSYPEELFWVDERKLLHDKGFEWAGRTMGGYHQRPWGALIQADPYPAGPRRVWCTRPRSMETGALESPTFGTLEPLLVRMYLEGWI